MMHSGIELASSTSLITGDRLIIFPSVVSLRAHLQCLIALLRLKSALARHLELPVPEQSLFGEMCCSPEPVVQDEKEQVGAGKQIPIQFKSCEKKQTDPINQNVQFQDLTHETYKLA